MRFLIDADLPRRTAGLIKSYGHESVDVRDMGLGGASDEQVAAYARAHQMCLLTGDFGFADIRNYPPEQFGGLVVLEIPKNATADRILRCRAGSRSWSGATCASGPGHKPWVRS